MNKVDDTGNLAIPWQIKVALIAGIAGAIYKAIKFWKTTTLKKSLTKAFMKSLAKAIVRGFVQGFVVGLLSTIPKVWLWGVAGATLSLMYGISTKQVKNVSSGVSAILNGWSCGVVSGSLNVLTKKVFKMKMFRGVKSKDLIGYIVDLIGGYGVARYIKW